MVYEEDIRSTVPRQKDRVTKIGDYMEIKTTYKQRNTLAIMASPATNNTTSTTTPQETDYSLHTQVHRLHDTVPLGENKGRDEDSLKKTGLTEQEIDKAYEYFDERAPNLFNSPNVRSLIGLPQLRQVQRKERDYSENEDDEEEDEVDDYDTAFGERERGRQSAGTTRASEIHMKPRPLKGRGTRRPPGSLMTNLYHAHITNFHAVALPMTTMSTTANMQQEQTQGLLHDSNNNRPKAELLLVWLLSGRRL
eukprot:5101363-Amphidinium_carterae.6